MQQPDQSIRTRYSDQTREGYTHIVTCGILFSTSTETSIEICETSIGEAFFKVTVTLGKVGGNMTTHQRAASNGSWDMRSCANGMEERQRKNECGEKREAWQKVDHYGSSVRVMVVTCER